MKKNKVSCKEVMLHVCESLGEELNSPKCVTFKMHLESCTHCQNYFSSLESTIKYFRQYKIELPDESHKKLMTLLSLE